ncbi:MAG: hypothetical protein L0Z62_18440 [Gemmataceae bacterium]|nr:hypothetical protein [Gemmataceae bacterium]
MSDHPENVQESPPVSGTAMPILGTSFAELERLLGETIAPIVVQAWAAFRRDLPGLLAKHPGKWVAYSGDQQLGIGTTKTQLYQECLRRGLARGQFLVLSIEPEMPQEIDLPLDV